LKPDTAEPRGRVDKGPAAKAEKLLIVYVYLCVFI